MTRWKASDIEKIKHKIRQDSYEYVIGIDVGTKTGFAVWSKRTKVFICLETLKIHQAMDRVEMWKDKKILVRVEDARMVKYKTDPVKAQGAGSVKRDSQIWFDFLTDHQIPFEMVRPNNMITKWNAEDFEKRTGFKGRTSSHSRDAGLIVFNY